MGPPLPLFVSTLHAALMQDQVAALQRRGIAAALLSSTLDSMSRQALISCLENGLRADHLGGQLVLAEPCTEGISKPAVGALGTKGSLLRMLYATPEQLATPT